MGDDLLIRRAIQQAACVRTWDGETFGENCTREELRDLVAAVLQAVREPDADMLDRFVSRALQVSIHGEGGWSNYGRNQWQAMIDSILARLKGE